MGSQPESTPDVARRHLLLDSRVIEDVQNAELVLGAVEKHEANPLFEEDQPWEMRFDNLYANVIYDDAEQIYKCWYSPFIVARPAKGMTLEQRRATEYTEHFREMGICYATSTDGLNWIKPNLGLVEYEGSKANNIVWRGSAGSRALEEGPHGAGVFKDLRDPDPSHRYKALLKQDILSVAFSADGIQWGPAIACPEANSAGDCHNNAFWAPTLGKYVGITRQWRRTAGKSVRQVARTASADFLSWEATQDVLEGSGPSQQTYAMPVFFHGGIYLGLVAIHEQETDRVWTELTWSPDTETWHRVLPGTPLIPNTGNEGDYDWGCVYAAANPIFLNDGIRLYYGASDWLHTSWRNGYLALATLRPDGFAGYKASGLAAVTTIPFFDGNTRLRVSADVAKEGQLVVRALSNDGSVIAESAPIAGTVTDADVRWQDDRALDANKGQPARLQFAFEEATVYSFNMADG